MSFGIAISFSVRWLQVLFCLKHAPNEEAKEAFPSDLKSPSPERRAIIFHESTLNANDSLQWGTPDSQMIRPKSRGSGIMVSDFIMEKHGYLRLTNEYDRAMQNYPNARKAARDLLEYGESRDGYWNSDKFMKHTEKAVFIAEAKFPKDLGYRFYWIFDQSTYHTASTV